MRDPRTIDLVRRKYIVQLANYTQRAVFVYASRFTQVCNGIDPASLSIRDEDLQGLMAVMHQIPERGLDLILHSPGGDIAAAESIVKYLRSKFTDDIRVIVPHLAMSAATMIACAANKVVLGKHSFLGPVDPQFVMRTSTGVRVVSAQVIEEQFRLAKREIAKDPVSLQSWVPILSSYGPDLLQQSAYASELSRNLTQEWLTNYMFKGVEGGDKRAEAIAKWLSTHEEFNTHGRHLDRETLRTQGLLVEDLEKDEKLQDLVLSVFHATTITFDMAPVIKVIENHKGAAFVRLGAAHMPLPAGPPPSQPDQPTDGPKFKITRRGMPLLPPT